MGHKKSKKFETITINTEELSPHQVRLIKVVNSLMQHVLSTEEEEEYFNGSSELLRTCASLIKQANFVDQSTKGYIPYAEQALEYGIEILSEHIDDSKVILFDN